MKIKYDNVSRLERVGEKEWREALDEVTAYLRWRLKGKTKRGAHSERELGMPALDYYQEEAVVKLIEGDWLWQERFTLGEQLVRIATDLVSKQVKKWEREHPWLTEDGTPKTEHEMISKRKQDLIELTDDMGQFAGILDDDGQEELDDTYNLVYELVEDDEELTIFVSAIEHCGNFKDLPEHTGWEIKHVYRLMEKLMRRIKRWKCLQNIERSERL